MPWRKILWGVEALLLLFFGVFAAYGLFIRDDALGACALMLIPAFFGMVLVYSDRLVQRAKEALSILVWIRKKISRQT